MAQYDMTHADLLALIEAVQSKRLAAAAKKPWCPPPEQWADPTPWTAIPSGGAPRLWMHLADYPGWREARLALAEAWPTYSGPPTKPVLLGLILAGELDLLNDATRRWPLRCSLAWCQTAFDRLMSAHYDQNAGLPLPLSLGLADWVVQRAQAHPYPVKPGRLQAWSQLFHLGQDHQAPYQEQALMAWWHRAHALGESANGTYVVRSTTTHLFRAVQKRWWDLAEQLVNDGADPNSLVPQKGNALLTAIQKERAGELAEPDRQRMLGLVYCMLDHGLDWQQGFPFPGQLSFEGFLASNSVLHRVDERWHALTRQAHLDQGLPSEATPSSPRPKPRF